MNLLPQSIILLAALSASCASVNLPTTRTANHPANPSAAEAPIQKMDLFGPAEIPIEGAEGAPADAAVPGLDHSTMDHSPIDNSKKVDSIPAAKHTPATSAETYTCPMHPQIAQPGPGKCPICEMALVKKPGEKK